MTAVPGTDTNDKDPQRLTLGDLLYADTSRSRVAEEEWVALVASVAAGDQSALHSLYQRTNRIVFTLIMRITGNRQTAEELTLDVFHDVWRRAAGYEPKAGTVVGWIMNQARSRAIDQVRFEQRRKRVNPHPQDGAEDTDGGRGERLVESHERASVLQAGLARLSDDERQAVEQAFFAELTHVEVAAKLDLPLGTVKTRIRSALAKLRDALPAPEATP